MKAMFDNKQKLHGQRSDKNRLSSQGLVSNGGKDSFNTVNDVSKKEDEEAVEIEELDNEEKDRIRKVLGQLPCLSFIQSQSNLEDEHKKTVQPVEQKT